jgi:hypothetical protein
VVHLKKFVTIATSAILLAAMVGCSSSASNSNAASSDAQANPSSTQQSGQPKGANRQYQRKSLFDNQELLSLLKIDSATLKQELKAGKSLADIAAEKKVPEQQVIDLMVKDSAQRIDQSVQSGKVSQDKATQMKAKMQEQIKKNVERKGGFGFGGKRARTSQGDQQNSDSSSSSSSSSGGSQN